jgi:hypothetical protein
LGIGVADFVLWIGTSAKFQCSNAFTISNPQSAIAMANRQSSIVNEIANQQSKSPIDNRQSVNRQSAICIRQ